MSLFSQKVFGFGVEICRIRRHNQIRHEVWEDENEDNVAAHYDRIHDPFVGEDSYGENLSPCQAHQHGFGREHQLWEGQQGVGHGLSMGIQCMNDIPHFLYEIVESLLQRSSNLKGLCSLVIANGMGSLTSTLCHR
ncbi:hypothetical protein Scep_004510 [Stephania cephalantha]|uniref:Uncharacterized protein n=1 Tax=Stephania cephalantha TaxID=152367 RepID=A0AAP0KST8_9MAGN